MLYVNYGFFFIKNLHIYSKQNSHLCVIITKVGLWLIFILFFCIPFLHKQENRQLGQY